MASHRILPLLTVRAPETYTYYNNGNISTITDGIDGNRSQTFSYDHLDRLTQAVSNAYESRLRKLQANDGSATMNIKVSIKNGASMIAVLILLMTSHSYASYDYSSIEYPGAIATQVNGINNNNQIVGAYWDKAGRTYGFLLDGIKFRSIKFPRASWTTANGINDRGQIVGTYSDGTRLHGFLLSHGHFSSIDYPGAYSTDGRGINNHGQYTGRYWYNGGTNLHGFLKEGDSFSDFGQPYYGINDSGQIVGEYVGEYTDNFLHGLSGFIKSGDDSTFIDYPGADWTIAYGISNNGQVVGTYSDLEGVHGFILNNNEFRSVSPGAAWTDAYGVNDRGIIVGSYADHGFVAIPVVFEQIRSIEINIRPWSLSNRINLKSNGIIPVAVLTNDSFDATTVNPMSVAFGPNKARAIPGKGHIMDIDGDGDFDLVLYFRIKEIGVACGDTEAGLTGVTFDGQLIEGFDFIHVVGCK
jgi:uncharacterized membrane protein